MIHVEDYDNRCIPLNYDFTKPRWSSLFSCFSPCVLLEQSTGAFFAVSRYAGATPIPPSVLSRGVGWQVWFENLLRRKSKQSVTEINKTNNMPLLFVHCAWPSVLGLLALWTSVLHIKWTSFHYFFWKKCFSSEKVLHVLRYELIKIS